MENAPHQAYPGRTTQKRSRGRDLKRSPLSGSAGKKVDYSFFLVHAICDLYSKCLLTFMGERSNRG